MNRLETKVPPVIWWAWASLIVLFVDVTYGDSLAAGWGRFAGALLGVAGIAVAVLALVGFGRAQTTVDPHTIDKASTLVTDGVYQFTRNPMYLGLLLLVLGWGLWRGSVLGALLGAAFFVAIMTRFQILPEERMLMEKFGEEYTSFTNTVRRWI